MNFWSKRNRKILVAVSLLLAAAPVVGGVLLIERHSRSEAEAQIQAIATEFVERSDAAIDNGLDTLAELARQGVDGCDAADLAAMRRAVFEDYWVKEVGFVAAGGGILCNQNGEPVTVTPLSPSYDVADDGINEQDIALRLVVLGTYRKPGLLVTLLRSDTALGVMVPVDAVAMSSVARITREQIFGALLLDDGETVTGLTAIGLAQRTPGSIEAASATERSARYPVTARMAMPLDVFRTANRGLFTSAVIGGGALGLIILLLSLYVLKGPPAAVSALREAVERDEIIPYYQPVIDIATNRLVGCEALVRWRKPDGTVLPATDFVPLAETNGVAEAMTRSIMRQVRDDLGECYGKRPWLKVNINLFDAHFDSRRTAWDVRTIFERSPMAFGQLVFELTERQPLRDIGRARRVIDELHALGAKVALDDAGTGHSGLAYIQELGVDVVKIDKMFIDTIPNFDGVAPVIDSLIRLCHVMGMEVVAEGVETMEQFDYLAARGADSVQGYLFSPPLPARAFLDLVEAVSPVTSAEDAGPVRANAVNRQQVEFGSKVA